MSLKPRSVELFIKMTLKTLARGKDMQLFYDLLFINVLSSSSSGWIAKYSRLHIGPLVLVFPQTFTKPSFL